MFSQQERQYAEDRMVIASRPLGMAARILFFIAVFAAVCSAICCVLIAVSGVPVIGESATVQSSWTAVWTALFCASAIFIALMLRHIMSFCDRVEEFGTPFVRANVSDVDFLWKALLAIGVVWGGIVPLLGVIFQVESSPSFSLLPFSFFAVFVIMFLARVFEYGCALQEQDDELL